MADSYLEDLSGKERTEMFFLNWFLFVACPIWLPIAFTFYVIGHRDGRRRLFTGKGTILE